MKLIGICVHLKHIGILIILMSHYSYAQKDYIITNKGDTIYGSIKRHDFSQIKFQEFDNGENRVFKVNDIIDFYIPAKGNFESVFVPKQNRRMFLQLLEDGKIKLYEFIYTMWGVGPTGGKSVDKFWYAKKDSDLVEIKTNRWYGSRKKRADNFYNLIKEDKVIVSRYEDEKKFSFEFLRSIIHDYNNRNESK